MLILYRDIHYDPQTGRFLQIDPHPGITDDPISVINRMVYAGSDPINSFDPLGTFNLRNAIALTTSFVVGFAIGFGAGVFVGPAIGAIIGSVVGYAIGGEVAYRVNRLLGGSKEESQSMREPGRFAGALGGAGGGILGESGLPTLGQMQNATVDKLTMSYLTSNSALSFYGLFLVKYLANQSCNEDEVYSFSAGGKCIKKNKGGVFYERFL